MKFLPKMPIFAQNITNAARSNASKRQELPETSL
jgi:hypothetical protein